MIDCVCDLWIDCLSVYLFRVCDCVSNCVVVCLCVWLCVCAFIVCVRDCDIVKLCGWLRLWVLGCVCVHV